MEKNTVTRTFSIGGICTKTKSVQSDDFFAARRHSSAGVRALLWATSSAKSFGSSLGSDSQTSRDNIFPNVLTPDSIPQFTIPSLSVHSSFRSLENTKEAKDDDVESEEGSASSGPDQEAPESTNPSYTSSTGFTLVLSDRRAERSVSDPFTTRRSALQREALCSSQHCLDPASRAALSLPHLAKVTTPYGFVTLSQSPQMASEEALLCQAGLRRSNRDEEAACCPNKASRARTVDANNKKTLCKDASDSQTKATSVKGELEPSLSTTASVSSSPGHSDGNLKRRFYNIIKKHFTS